MIPDHEVLRKIGGGAYGEVWLARGVTGAMRAVKIVYREDFSDERTFEREFEGILRFEPISRDHQGFVNILHVGRSADESGFYYYVMELGDDVHEEGEVNPVEYEPRTLRTDMLRASGSPLPTDFCIESGRRLAEALAELHERGLTHRDVKPSNVIFVEGKAKLADIGLVAAKDQRTFVGTEGFVPPEGPGSEQADIYGLGKVLYEMATGMDRLQFPELPEQGPGDDQRKKWIRLNRMICDICDPRLAKRKIQSGKELADALSRLQQGKAKVKKVPLIAKLGLIFLALVGLFTSQIWIEKTWGTHIIEGKREPLPPRFVMVKVISDPEGAEVYNEEGELLDYTPANLPNREVGTELVLYLKAPRCRELKVEIEVVDEGQQVMVINETLSLFSPPKEGEPWYDFLGKIYLPHGAEGDQHQSSKHVSEADWRRFLKERDLKFKEVVFSHGGQNIVATAEWKANEYAKWLMENCIEEGYFEQYSEENLDMNRQIIADYDRRFPENKLPAAARVGERVLRPFYCIVRPIPYGTIAVDTVPSGAYVYINDVPVGVTPFGGPGFEEKVIPGEVELRFEYGGYTTFTHRFQLPDGGDFQEIFTLKENYSLTPGERWTNSLGMRMEPLGETLMAAAWETRSGDYRAYLKATGQQAGELILSDDPEVPVVGLTRAECEAFCEWLTQKERPDFINQDYRYRLPTDEEWSWMVGLVEEGEGPAEREKEIANQGKFPWGESFPPEDGAGNYSDRSASELIPSEKLIEGYDDGFAKLAPVGKFVANDLGLYDLGGNVHEWVSDSYLSDSLGVLRGGGWNSFSEPNLESRFRNLADIDSRKESFGFRVVLAKEPEDEQKEAPLNEDTDG